MKLQFNGDAYEVSFMTPDNQPFVLNMDGQIVARPDGFGSDKMNQFLLTDGSLNGINSSSATITQAGMPHLLNLTSR